MRRLSLLLTLALLGLASMPARAAEPGFSALVRSRQLPYIGELVINGRTVVRVTHGVGDRLRQEILSPPGMAGELILDNGRTRWHYSPRTSLVDISPSVVSARQQALSERLMARNFKLIVLKKALIAGRPTTVVEVHPLFAGRDSQRLWLDQATQLPLRVERLSPQGQLRESSEFRRIEVPATPSLSAFEFELPPHAKVSTSVQLVASGRTLGDLKAKTSFPIKMPSYLPQGFEVLDVHLIETKGVRSIHWRLSDGLDMLSLFQTDREHEYPQPRSARALDLKQARGYMLEHGAHRMLCWVTEAGAFTLIGDLSLDDLKRIATSTIP